MPTADVKKPPPCAYSRVRAGALNRDCIAGALGRLLAANLEVTKYEALRRV